MPAKIESPFSTGLPAKIYWCIYIEPSNGYELAKIIYGKPKTPQTGKIYPTIHKMEKNGFIKVANGICYPILEKLLLHLDVILKNQDLQLDDSTKFYLNCLLDSSICKSVFAFYYSPASLHKIKHRDANFVANISQHLAISAVQNLLARKTQESNLDQIFSYLSKNAPDEFLSQFQPFTKKNLYKTLVASFDVWANNPKLKGLSDPEQIEFLKNHFESVKKQLVETESKAGFSINMSPEMAHTFSLWQILVSLLPTSVLLKMSALNLETSNMMLMVDKLVKMREKLKDSFST